MTPTRISPEPIAGVATWVWTAIAASAVTVPIPAISLVDHGIAVLIGVVAGFVISRTMGATTLVGVLHDIALSVAFAGIFGPAFTQWLIFDTGLFNSAGPLLLIPASAFLGLFMPALYRLILHTVQKFHDNPQGIVDLAKSILGRK